jgi:two-component system, NarL family, invasion response regulator UvrY
MIRILVADDHAIVRRGLRQIVADESDMEVVGEAQTTQEILDLARQEEWDVIVLNISMPGRGGFEALKALKQTHSKRPVLVLSMYPEDQFAVRAFRAGAAGYMTKESAPEELVQAIRKVVRGGKYVSPSLAEKLAAELGEDAERPPHEALSEREYHVLCLLASGKTVTQIAAEMSLSVKTISTYRARLLEKMRMKTNAQVTRYAIEHRLVA